MSTGAGVCVSGATASPTATIVVTALAAKAATVAGAAGANVAATAAHSFTSDQGQITSCWNPAGAASVTVTNTATSVAAACYVSIYMNKKKNRRIRSFSIIVHKNDKKRKKV